MFVRAWNNQDVSIARCVAYCPYHKYYLTKQQLKRKKCLGKQCKHLQKLEHYFWKERERIRKERKKRKNDAYKIRIK